MIADWWPSRRSAVGVLVLLLAGHPWPGCATQHARPAASADAEAAESRPATTVIAVFGDGYAEALTEGLKADFAGKPDTTIVQATHAPSGLADGSAYDWVKAAQILMGQRHVDCAVVMLGANDEAPLQDGAAAAEPLSPRWRDLYAGRVQALADAFARAHVSLIWVGLPIVADEAQSADFVVFNEITRDRTVAAGGAYVDAWNAFADEAGRYSAFGPDAKGRITRLRTGDGFDLTRAGSIKLAGFVEPELRARRAASAPPTTPDVVLSHQPDFDDAATIDVNAQIRREAGLPALPGGTAADADREPILPLAGPARSADGRLATPTSDPAPLIGTGGTLAQRALVEGLPIPPKPGRTDDFSWPPAP